jgi:phosphatidylglycerol:prolipoprotein diacylglycerol transferase
MMMIGFLGAILWACRRCQKSGGNPDIILNCGFIALIGGVVGARAMYVMHYWNQFGGQASAWATFWSVVDVRKGGLEFYGGFVLAMIGIVGYLVLWRHSLRWYLDIMAPSAMVGLAFGRVGCLLNGCCWGDVSHVPWAVTFPYASPPQMAQWQGGDPRAGLPAELMYTMPGGYAFLIQRENLRASAADVQAADMAAKAAEAELAKAQQELAAAPKNSAQERAVRTKVATALKATETLMDVRGQMAKFGLTLPQLEAKAAAHRSLPVHPTQAYSTITAGLLALILDRIYWRRRRDGQVVCALLLMEPIARYLIETLRADNPIDTFGFTVSQAIAVGLTLTGLIGFFVLRALPARSPRAVVWIPPPEPAKKKG